MNRREFLGSSTAAALAPSMFAASDPEWFEKAMRWAQMVFVEDDPGNYNPQFWLDYFQRTHSDAACLAAGGYMAFYPTTVPFHHTSSFMKPGMDPFGELLNGCRKLGMAVIARTDPHACRNDILEAHPDWISVDENGQKRRHWADSRLWVTCTLGPYNWEFMTAVHREIMQLYKPDGIFVNRWEGPPSCFCEHCRRNFKSDTGLDLPRRADPADRAHREYVVWRQNRFFELWKRTDRELRAINPHARFIPNVGGIERLLDMARISELSSIAFIDRQARRNSPAWFSGRSAKEYGSTMGRKPVGSITSVGHEEGYRWKDSVQSEPEYRLFFADAIANGCRPWFTKFNAKIIDQRWLKPVEEIYTWAWKNEKYFRNESPIARVAIVYSQQTVHNYAADAVKDKYDDHLSGMYEALIESRIPFQMVHDRQLEAANIDRFKLLLLPNLAALSDAQCRQIAEFVERGGSIVATFETSLYDEWGAPRKDFGLAKLFGCSFEGKVQRRMQNSYLSLEHATKHPLLKGLDEAPRIINGARRVATRSLEAAYRSPLTLVPTYPDLPMEEVYPRANSKTTQPEAYCFERGKGRVVYFPFDLDRIFLEVMAVDHLQLLRNAFEWAANEPPPVHVTGPGILDITAWRQKSSITVHLVNLTNPMYMRGPLREILPVGKQTVRLTLPPGAAPKAVKLLTAGVAAKSQLRGRQMKIEVPSIELHEVVAIDL